MNQKGFAPILILVGFLVLIAAIPGGAYYLKSIKNQQPAVTTSKPSLPTPFPTPSDASPAPTGAAETADWKIYKNTYFTFKYPKDWGIVSESVPDNPHYRLTLQLSPLMKNGYYDTSASISIGSSSEDLKAVSEGIQKSKQFYLDKNINTQLTVTNTTFLDYPAIEVLVEDKNKATIVKEKEISVEKQFGTIKSFLFTEKRFDEAPYDQIYTQILSTFKFTQ